MTPTLVALCPVLNRPKNLGPLVQSFNDSLEGENVEASMLFLVNVDDTAEIKALRELALWHIVVPWGNGPRDYVRKMLWGVARTTSDWILLAADDLRFHKGWFRAALNVHIASGCLVIGTNDMANPTVMRGDHATHPLVHREYVKYGTIDNPDELLHSGYCHNSVDCEFVETAKARGQFAHARGSLVEHIHPTFRRTVKRDSTYQKGMEYALRDKQLFRRRRKLWDPSAPVVREPVMTRRRVKPISTWPVR